ncbi:unnamed protein product, partial [Amoebophrya sp. A25]|eukprot:GSA25T00025032001.1
MDNGESSVISDIENTALRVPAKFVFELGRRMSDDANPHMTEGSPVNYPKRNLKTKAIE